MHLTGLAVFVALVVATKSSPNSEEKLNFLLRRVQDLEIRDATHQNEIQYLKSKLASMESNFALKTQRMESEIEQCKYDLMALSNQSVGGATRRALAQTRIAFYAIASPHYVEDIDSGEHIRFDTVFTNLGNAYNPNTGSFIAPIGGTYAFSITISGRQNSGITSYFTINVNHELRGKLISHTLQQDSQFLVLTLRAGDSVYVTAMENDNGILGTYYSTFSGFLMYE